MSVSSGPPELPPDSPGSSVSSRLQNEYTDLLRRAVMVTHDGQTTNLTINPDILGPPQRTMSKTNESPKDLIDLNGFDTQRTDTSHSENSTEREQLSKIPTLDQLLSTGVFLSNELDNQLASRETDSNDPIVHHLLRYSELVSNDLESKPITEKMDHWYLDLKKNLMNEFDKLRLQFLEEAQQVTLREKQAQAKEYIRLNQDIKTMREMLTHYEQTIDQKDQTEKNLSKGLDFLYNKTLIYRRYYEWRLIHIERRRQQYAFALAKRFHEDRIKRRVMSNWRTMVEQEWKKRFEKACEQKAKDVLLELGNEYELKYKQLELQLLNANDEIARLKMDRGEQDEALKKAFMRGVCALNMEAMSVLLNNQQDAETMPFITDELRRRRQEQHAQTSDEGLPVTGSSLTSDENHLPVASSTHRCHTLPTHVYKESLPSTIYRSGEARPVRSAAVHHNTRQVTFEKRPTTNRNRTSNTNIFVERHAPSNRLNS